MECYNLSSLEVEHKLTGRPYLQFISENRLSVGLYKLKAAEDDLQTPHGEDEVYYVINGRARIRVGEENRDIGPGSIVFVAADVDHRFYDIKDDLEIIVFFAPSHTPA